MRSNVIRYRALRGMKDILPGEIRKWHLAEATAREIFRRHGFREIRTPMLESYDLFARSVGESTDIVHKEMYVMERGEEKIALRPENTAAVARAYIEHSLNHGSRGDNLPHGPVTSRTDPSGGDSPRSRHRSGCCDRWLPGPWPAARSYSSWRPGR